MRSNTFIVVFMLPKVTFCLLELRYLNYRNLFINNKLYKCTPGRTRTLSLLIRSQTLYPVELRAHQHISTILSFQIKGCTVICITDNIISGILFPEIKIKNFFW